MKATKIRVTLMADKKDIKTLRHFGFKVKRHECCRCSEPVDQKPKKGCDCACHEGMV